MAVSVRSKSFVVGQFDAAFWVVPKEVHHARAVRAGWRAYQGVVLPISIGRANPATRPDGIADE